jgi:hypothetical protein
MDLVLTWHVERPPYVYRGKRRGTGACGARAKGVAA